MSKYCGYGRFIVFKCGGEFCKYELVHSEITQFGHTVPYRRQSIQLELGTFTTLGSEPVGELIQPHEWLDEHINECMPYEVERFIEDGGFKMEEGELAEICGFISVEDTSRMTDCGWEYDCCNSLEEPQFTVFKLEDLKESYYYSACSAAGWLEKKDGLESGTVQKLYDHLVEGEREKQEKDETEEDMGC